MRRDCACTFYLVFKEPEFLATFPVSFISFRGTFLSYGWHPLLSTPPARIVDFFLAPAVGAASAMRRRVIAPDEVRALRCDLGCAS